MSFILILTWFNIKELSCSCPYIAGTFALPTLLISPFFPLLLTHFIFNAVPLGFGPDKLALAIIMNSK